MEAFEKWYNKEIRPYIHNPKDKMPAKAGWKAALEWAQNSFDGEGCAGSFAPGLQGCDKLMDEIEEELRE